MKWQNCTREYSSLGEKGLPMALEVAALQANAIERDEREVTKDNSAIMARDKGCEGQRIHI